MVNHETTIRGLLRLSTPLLIAILILIGCVGLGILYQLASLFPYGFIIVPTLTLSCISYLSIRYQGLWLVRHLWMLRQTLPSKIQEIQIPGLKQSVKVDFDKYGIPSVYAFDLTDATLALGY